jgi:Fic family protein
MKKPLTPPSVDSLLEQIRKKGGSDGLLETLVKIAGTEGAPRGRYYHWDTLRHLTPPEGLTHEEWWLGVKMARRSSLRELPLLDSEGRAFYYGMPDEAQELVHYIDQQASGEIRMPEVVTDSQSARKHYLVNSLIEEAIRSSQLEGATTTYDVAKEMIRSGRPPRDRSERMIKNNFLAMEFMLDDVGERLTPETVLELQRILTDDTLDNTDAAGRLQTIEDRRVVVADRSTGAILHRPPPADQLPARLELMCRFANGEEGGSGFLHPAVRAILLHFWLAFDHPFEDGNGRTARALFYWLMRVRGYWLTEYLSISRILREAPSKYLKPFLYTETDERDTTYFLLFQLGVMQRGIRELHTHLQKKVQEVRETQDILRGSQMFNYRQLALLTNAVRDGNANYTFTSHSRSHRVTHQTARTDLMELAELGLLVRHTVRRQFVFAPAPDLAKQLATLGRKASGEGAVS